MIRGNCPIWFIRAIQSYPLLVHVKFAVPRGITNLPATQCFPARAEFANTKMYFVSAIYPSGLPKPAILKLSDQNTDEVGTRLAWRRYCAVPACESIQRLKAKVSSGRLTKWRHSPSPKSPLWSSLARLASGCRCFWNWPCGTRNSFNRLTGLTGGNGGNGA